ncbi:tetratricopeptide repeat protein [Nitrospira sp. Nam80]
MRRMLLSFVLLAGSLSAGCATDRKEPIQTLRAPAGTAAVVKQEMDRGNGLFASQDWTGAREAYVAVLGMDPSLAEAHYNLALALDQMGEKAEARKHYVTAANLAPGNRVIWNAPPLRKFDREQELGKKSFMDASPR